MSHSNLLRTAPSQKRSNTRVEAILEAARVHYEEAGRDNFTTGGVAALAGCSVGTVYRYFSDRVVLMDAIMPGRDSDALALQAIREVNDLDRSLLHKWKTVQRIVGSA